MATNFTVVLDTTGPGSPACSIDGGAAYSGDFDVVVGITTSDGDTTGYQVKIYGDVDDSFAPSEYRAAEGNAPWVSFAATKNVRLSSGDGAKTVRIKIRDDVLNASSEATDAITVDSTLPVPNVTSGPDVTRVSKQATKDTVSFTFQFNEAVQAYKVKVVPATNSPDTAGTQIPTTAGSTNMSGGSVAGATPVAATIKGTDLETASSGDGSKIIKVFGQDENTGAWSV